MSADAQQAELPTRDIAYPCVHCGAETPGRDTTNNDQCADCLDMIRAADRNGEVGFR